MEGTNIELVFFKIHKSVKEKKIRSFRETTTLTNKLKDTCIFTRFIPCGKNNYT